MPINIFGNMDNYVMYTDGAYSSSKNQMGIGVIFVKDSKCILKYSKMFLRGTNNKAELGAIIIGLRAIKKPIDSLTIVTDSEYCIGCATLGWKRKKNQSLWKVFDYEFKRVRTLCNKIEFKYVKGHQNDNQEFTKWNNRADKLAVAASQRIIS